MKTPLDHIDYQNIKIAHQGFFKINEENEQKLDYTIIRN